MVVGVFDGLHPGHRFFLSDAARRCQELIVVVTLPEVVLLFKGKMPVHDLDARISEIRKYDPRFVVVAGDREVGSWGVLKNHKPDMVFLGYDQKAVAIEFDRIGMPYSFLDPHKPETYKSSLLNKQS